MSQKNYKQYEDIFKYSKCINKGRKQQKERNFIKSITQFGVYDEDVIHFQKTRVSKRVNI